jgi:hypothetical protein
METLIPLRVGKGLNPTTSDIKDDKHDPSLNYVESPLCKTKKELTAKMKEENVR